MLLGIAVALILLWASIEKLYKFHQLQIAPAQFSKQSIEVHYRDHLGLAYFHILPGIVFILLGAYQLTPFIRKWNYSLHRLVGKIFLLLATIIFATAIVLAVFFPFGNMMETLVTVVFGSFLLFSTFKAYTTARQKNFKAHRQWVIRVYFVALAVSTVRGIIALFLTIGVFQTLQEAFGLAFLLAFLLHFALVETWIKYLEDA